MDNNVYYVWLQQALRYGSHKMRTIRLLYKNIEDFYKANEYELRLCGCFTQKEIEALTNKNLEEAQKIVCKCNKFGYKILTPESSDYPHLLKEISNPPAVLYVWGDETALNQRLPIAIVGTRSATDYGKGMSHDIAKGLVKEGAVVVSGCAVGVDFAAHCGALEAGGKTIAVLGCGINYPYLMAHDKIRNQISKSGAVVSEYPPDYPASNYSFPVRNRIISGLSLGTVIIEAGKKSGSLITANLANEQNRDVFVVPVDMQSKLAEGAADLIRDGARVITCADDILAEYKGRTSWDFKYAESSSKMKPSQNFVCKKSLQTKTEKENFEKSKKENEKNLLKNFSEESKKIYYSLKNGKMHIDEITLQTGIPMHLLLSKITEMELLGIIKACSGRMYELNSEN